MIDSIPQVLVECKKVDADLQGGEKDQLHRYFGVLTEAHFGVLTNGLAYQFYSDIEQDNVMDADPFLEINLANIRDSDIEHLKFFIKSNFDKEGAMQSATNLKYMGAIKKVLESEYKNPSPDFVRYCIQDLHSGPKTQAVISKFTSIVKQAFKQLISDEVSYRLKIIFEGDKAEEQVEATESEEAATETKETEPEAPKETTIDNRIVTTEEEIAACDLIKDLLADTVEPSRISMRDRISYCGILLDDNNRKFICRLYFNQEPKLISFPEEHKEDSGRRGETKVAIEHIEDIRQHKEVLIAACALYVSEPST